MRRFQITAVTAGLIGGAMLLFGAAPASAATFPGSALGAAGETTMVEQVQRRGDKRARKYDRRARSYDRRRHGKRHRRSRSGYRHYHGGHYYASPWWLAAPAIGLGIGLVTPQVTGHSSHVQWCHNRFRSYNAATDSYLGYDGRYHRCNSPY